MRVYGEAYFFINGWMNFLSLLLAARLARLRFQTGRAVAASLAGAGYALLAWARGGAWRGVLALAASALLLSGLAFGGRALKAWPLVMAAGLLLSGCADLLMKKGVAAAAVMALCGLAAMVVCAALERGLARDRGKLRLRVTLHGKSALLPALRDSGNLLRDGVSGLPVIVVPERALRPLLPSGVKTNDLSTLPLGWYLVRVQTAGGSRALMCFHPEEAILLSGTRQWRVEAAVALSDFPEARALLPDVLFQQEEETSYASL